MNSMNFALLVGLVVLAACDARVKPYESNLAFQKRADPQPPCGNCSLNNVQLQGLVEAIKGLGPALQKVATLLGEVLNKAFTNLQDLKVAIQQVIKGIRDTIGPVLDKISAALANLDNCPALKDLFKNLKNNLYAILDTLDQQWYPLINAPDLTSTLTQLVKALKLALPNIIRLIRDLLYNLLQVLGLCQLLGNTVWTLLDPSPNNFIYVTAQNALTLLQTTTGANTAGNFLISLLNSLGGITDFLSTILASTPVGGIPNPGNLITILYALICALLKLLGLQFLFAFCFIG